MARYWISANSSNWNNIANWGEISGGPGNFSVPDTATDVFFDSSGLGACNLDTTAYALSLSFCKGYTLFNQNSYPLYVLSRFFCDSTVRIDGTSEIDGDLVLNSGALGGGRVNVYGDMTCGSSYNSWLSNNNAMLVMSGTRNQTIYNVGGGVLPSLWIDKS